MDDTENPATAWATELESILTDIGGGLARRLEALAASVPDDPTAFAALRRLTWLTRLAGPAPAPGDARQAAEARVKDAAPDVGGAVGRVVAALLTRCDGLLASGANDPAGGIVRLADFGRTYRLTEGRLGGLLVADVTAGLPAGHPAAAIIPYRIPTGERLRASDTGSTPDPAGHFLASGTLLLFLGRHPARWFWLSSVEATTAGFREAEEQRERERQRDAELAAEEARRAFMASPAGQRRRVRELEAQVAAMQAGSNK